MKNILLPLLAVCLCLPAKAQQRDDDFGMWYSLGAHKKLSSHWSAELEGEYRTRNDARTSDRFSLSASATYKLNRHVKLEGGYTFIDQHRQEKLTYTEADGNLNHWRPSYWTARHRIFAGMEGDVSIGRLNLSLRERWQYTYRPEKDTKRYDFDNEEWETQTVGSDAKHLLRSRLKAEYDFPNWKLDPALSVELFNAWRTEKVRTTLGTSYKWKKRHVFKAYYRFQIDREDRTAGHFNQHIIGLGYQYRF